VDVDFESFDLACISGQNGAGKSSLLDAMTWVLFGEARRRDDSIINSNAEAAEVALTFDYENNRYKVQRSKPRGKSTLLEFMQMDENGSWRPLTEATLRGTEEQIQKVLRLDYETFINASFFLQGKADQFATQRPSDRKRILSTTLGLEVWETYKDEAARRRKEAEDQAKFKDQKLNEIESELAEENDRKIRLAAAVKDYETQKQLYDSKKGLLDQQRVLQERFDKDRQQLARQQQEVTRQQRELEVQKNTLTDRQLERGKLQEQIAGEEDVKKSLEKWKNDQKRLEELDTLAGQFQGIESQRHIHLQVINSETTRLQTELANLKRSAVEIDSLQSSLSEKKVQIDAFHKDLEANKSRIESRPLIETEMRALTEEISTIKAGNQVLNSEIVDLRERYKNLTEVEGAACPVCGKPLGPDELQHLIAEVETTGKTKKEQLGTNTKKVEELNKRYLELDLSIKSLQKLEAQLQPEQRKLGALESEVALAENRLKDWQNSGFVELTRIQQQLQEGDYAHEARQQLAALDEEMKKLGYDPQLHESVRKTEKEGRIFQEAWTAVQKAHASLGPLDREILALEETIKNQEVRLDQVRKEFTEASTALEKSMTGLPDFKALENECFDLNQEVNRLLQLKATRQNEVDVLTNRREERAKIKSEKEVLNSQISQLKSLEKAFGKDGIPALLIEQALPEIEADANAILDRLSDGNMSVSFETQREFKDKKREDRKETLDILIRDGMGQREYELFSGGEAFRVNFAIRLALSRVLARRAGARLQTLIIDEGFGSQDAEGRQRLIEAINMVRGDFAKILVITHMEELKDAFSARIEVMKTDRGSRVEVIAA
jgi:exonuclease SbcC